MDGEVEGVLIDQQFSTQLPLVKQKNVKVARDCAAL